MQSFAPSIDKIWISISPMLVDFCCRWRCSCSRAGRSTVLCWIASGVKVLRQLWQTAVARRRRAEPAFDDFHLLIVCELWSVRDNAWNHYFMLAAPNYMVMPPSFWLLHRTMNDAHSRILRRVLSWLDP
jgi:hypothetical protein